MNAARTRKSGLKNKKNIPITFRWRREIQDFEWDRKIRRYVMAVAFILERHADADGKNVYPSVGTIADLAGIGIAKVREALKAMEKAGFIRTYAKTRYGTKLRRLVYKNHDIEVGDTRSTSKSETRSTTKRTQGTLGSPTSKSPTKEKSLSRSARSPSATVAPHSATSKPIISVPIIKGDLVVLERCKDHLASANSNLGKVTARAKSVVTKSQAQIDAENHRIRTEVDQILDSHVEGFHGYNGFYVVWEFKDPDAIEIFSLVYNDCNLFSHVCKTVQCFDRRQWHLVADEMQLGRFIPTERKDSIRVFLTDTSRRAFVALIDGIKRHRFSKHFLTQVAEQDLEVSDLNLLTINEIHSRFYRVSDSIVKEIREIQNRQHLHRLRKVDAEIFRSATNTGSDRMIVEKIVETVSEKVEVKGLERW